MGDEIRRLERNEVRKESLSNMEYLKNVIIKFIMLPPCDERTHLLPVLDTMLQLTQEEKKQIDCCCTRRINCRNTKKLGRILPTMERRLIMRRSDDFHQR